MNDPETLSTIQLAGLTVLTLVSLALVGVWMIGGVVLLGWSTRLALGKNPAHPETSRGLASALRWATRIGWTASFVLVPGPPQLIYSFIRPAPARFRLLSVIVSFSFVVGTGISIVVFALARSAGLTP